MIKVTTDKLRSGDRVHTHGGVVEIDGPPDVDRDECVYAYRNMRVVSPLTSIAPDTVLWTIEGTRATAWRVSRPGSRR